ncbi:protein kinase domain-containing protein [Novipirellula artificiosorum]|uniref:Serine/threonine-protein kinase PrkC n=1 Tax=Novipirellula artificiosorum TaxID=2528016 RepID=A0A5C6CTI6_9BACT|nr:protein kinase [Novipirellula artificiosorum]TWU27910.1 Serine/threonine-protein kinase PrkC [Novipirellula artificiosorum]
MPKLNDHPSREELSAYSLGQLPEERAVAIDSHISDCKPCCETIISLSSEDTFAGLLQEAGRLPTDQTADHDSVTANSASFDNIPQPLSEHPRYEILGLIGKGGMGDVYTARHRKMERTVALKVINRGLVQKAEAIDRFHREVKAAAQLSHPNIVTAYDADQAGDFHFMVMEYVDGVDLSQAVKKRGALPFAEACDYIRQAAIGLQHAHERGMVHRDIKPHNMMVTADGTVKILDFGLASLAPEALAGADSVEARGELTAAGAIMGTPDFISPEQAEDARNADIRSDIYSLGATLYYLLSGQVPFDDGSVMHKLRSHAQVEPAPLNSVRDDVPEELVAIASKMMAKDPDERYFTPKEVAEALESFLSTWQPSEANSPRQVASNGGNNAGSGGQKNLSDDSKPSRLPVVAKFLLYTSLLPIGLCVVNEFVPLGLFGSETDWFWYSILISLGLSTIGGIMLGVHQTLVINRNDQRKNGMTTDNYFLMIICLAVSAFILLTYLSDGNGHIEVTPQSDYTTLGTHPLTIVDTSGAKPLGGTSSTHQNDATGITTHSFKSANGRYNLTLVDKVLTVNGEKYTLENLTDAIRIVDERVEITRVMVGPQNGQPTDRDNAKVSSAFPTLQIMRVEEESTNLGNDVKRTWKLEGRGLDMVFAQILHISNGERRTAYQTKLELNAGHGDRQGQLVLHSQDRPNDQVALSLDLSFGNDHGESKSGPVSFAKGLGLSSISSQSLWDAQHIDQDDIAFLLTRAQYPSDENGSTRHRMDDLGAMVRASKQGAEFLVVILHWEAVSWKPKGTSEANKPELKITGKSANKGTAGLPSVYDWNFKGRDVGDLKVRLLLAQNGKTEVMQEFDFEKLPADFANKVRLEVKDAARSPKGRRVSAILFVESPVPSSSATVNEDKGLSIDVVAPFSNKIERADLESIESEQTELLLALSYSKENMTNDRSMESMTAATKDGNVTFLFVTLDWSPTFVPTINGKVTERILDRMKKTYAECKSYRDSGVIKSVFLENTVSPEFTVEYSFDTAFVRPDRFRFEIKDQDDDKLLISADGEDVQASWDIEPGNQKPESLELAMAQAIGFTGGDVGRIPAMLMPKNLDGWVDLDLIDPRQIEDGSLQSAECFRLEYSFRDEQVTLWIDKQSYLVRRIDERIKSDDIRIERTTNFDPTIDGKITDEMLEFDPPAPRADDDRAHTLPESASLCIK